MVCAASSVGSCKCVTVFIAKFAVNWVKAKRCRTYIAYFRKTSYNDDMYDDDDEDAEESGDYSTIF